MTRKYVMAGALGALVGALGMGAVAFGLLFSPELSTDPPYYARLGVWGTAAVFGDMTALAVLCVLTGAIAGRAIGLGFATNAIRGRHVLAGALAGLIPGLLPTFVGRVFGASALVLAGLLKIFSIAGAFGGAALTSIIRGTHADSKKRPIGIRPAVLGGILAGALLVAIYMSPSGCHPQGGVICRFADSFR